MNHSAPFVAQIWRHPIKAHGAEHLKCVDLLAGKTLPWDRVWAVPHSAAKTDGGKWVSCRNFTRGAGYPSLMAIDAQFDSNSEEITLSHPDRENIQFRPDNNPVAFLEWVTPLLPPERPSPTGLLRATAQGMTDQSKPWVSILNLASLRALSDKLGTTLDPRRFRGNFWIDGLPAWAEREWIGQKVSSGSVEFDVTQHITRCRATEVDPETGLRDVDTLGALHENWDHRDFGVFAQVSTGGTVTIGDNVEIAI
ncbi:MULTISPECIES: MOSC domain-containing protein [Falsihalocynthiibacter]|uniref:MOSC domain-containing protein n=1 Tax=Falsihalocynthiibacter TaxID=2854182 RepID=UPI003001C0A9